MDNLTRFKKGESLCKEGEPINQLIIVQRGKVSLYIERSGRRVEILSLGPNQVIGEQAIFSNARHTYSAEAAQETKVMIVPVELIKKQVLSAAPGAKLLLKSLIDESKIVRKIVQGYKMEGDNSPCPQVSIPRVFSLINLVGRHTGKDEVIEVKPGQTPPEENPNEVKPLIVGWGILKLYASRIFNESFTRMRGALDILTKLEKAELILGQSEEGETELDSVKIFDIQALENFAEFYQYHYFKGGRSEVLQVDALALKVAKALNQSGKDLSPDRKGIIAVPYDSLLKDLKSEHKLQLKNTHFDLLEKKGLFVVRKTDPDGNVTLQFDKNEFLTTVEYWKIIHEINLWNDRGEVVMVEEVEAVEGADSSCPTCNGPVGADHKFCPGCGHSLQAA